MHLVFQWLARGRRRAAPPAGSAGAQAEPGTAREDAARAATLESERRYRLLAENASDIICRSGLDGRISFISPSVARILGYAPEELQGKTTSDYMPPEDALRISAEYAAHIAAGPGGPPIDMQFRVLHKNGEIVWLEGRPKIAWSEDGVPLEVFDIVRDITARKTQEQAQEQDRARRAEEAAAQAKSDFLANMSHELRTPLTGILGYADMLAHTDGLDAVSRRRAAKIGDAGGLLLALVNDVLDMSRIETSGVALAPRPVALDELMTDAVACVRTPADAKGLLLSVAVPHRAVWALADPDRLRQVMLNLLANAVKFTEAGSVHVTMASVAAHGREDVTIAVRDTGIGIAPDRLAHVFGRFEQADGSSTRRFGGTGLGLAICHAIVLAMDGTLEAAGLPGGGSVFTVRLSLPAAAAAEQPAPSPEVGALAGGRVLVADDVDMNRDVIRLMLEARGLHVTCVEDGAAAAEAAASARFDLVLMDVHMPRMDGLQATRTIRAARGPNRSTPILALTASVLPEEVARCREAGMDGHLGKPFTPDGLVAAMAACITGGAVMETSLN